MTLLDDAKNIEIKQGRKAHLLTNSGIREEQIEVALAWISGEITTTQASVALFKERRPNAPHYISGLLREAYEQGLLIKK